MDSLTPTDLARLDALCPGGVLRGANLAQLSQWRIGGKADLLIRPSSADQLEALCRFFHHRGMTPVVIGMTSNLLFDDRGVRAPCIQIAGRMAKYSIKGSDVVAQAGLWVPGLARALMRRGLTGGEHICGIPGTIGGLVTMNGGSQRKGIGSNIVAIESVDAEGIRRCRSAAECNFGYRYSMFHDGSEIITGVHMRFMHGDRSGIRSEMRAILADRRRKFPRKEPNCGSVFKSNPEMYAIIGPPGAAIERLGFKGKSIGGALVSPKHANFIVNTGEARASDVLALISAISESVFDTTGIRMEAEARYVTPMGRIVPADQVSLEEAA